MSKNKKLTKKQEKFCNEYIKTNNASEAYRRSYNAEKMKGNTINSRAKELLKNGPVAARIEELQAELREKNKIDQEYILKEYKELLESCKIEGLDGDGTVKDRTNWAKALAQITKMLGLDAPSQQEITHKGVPPLFPDVNYDENEDEEE